MKILIAGLGLIGGSLAKALKGKYEIYGFDRQNVIDFALNNNIIDGVCKKTDEFDFVIVALPPDAALDFILRSSFKGGAVVTDVCGIKGYLHGQIDGRKNIRYVGCHPMAGKEKGGIKNSNAKLFEGASLIITESEATDESAVELAKKVYLEAGFAKIVKCSPKRHDEIIAYTSQLAHIVSNAYIKSDCAASHKGFTGGSFQDMTRIAGLDEELWAQLFMLNREPLLSELDGLIKRLEEYKSALEDVDVSELKAILKAGRLCKEKAEK